MAKRAYLLKKTLLRLLFPRRICLRCTRICYNSTLCAACRDYWLQQIRCTRCAEFMPDAAVPDDDGQWTCERCQLTPPPFVQARSALPYRGRMRQRLLDYKYRSRPGLRRAMAQLLYEQYVYSCSDRSFDIIVPMPLAPGRLRQRGYNQSELMSRILSAELEVEHLPQALLRIRETPSLSGLSPEEREQAVAGAFAAEPELVSGRKVLLVDDIYTSGASSRAATEELLRAGAKEVYVLCIAAGIDDRQQRSGKGL